AGAGDVRAPGPRAGVRGARGDDRAGRVGCGQPARLRAGAAPECRHLTHRRAGGRGDPAAEPALLEGGGDVTGAHALVARNLAAGYGSRVGLRDVGVCLAGGELACVLGPNGTGKSTLLRTLAGMQPRLAGSVELDGHDVQRLPARELARRVSVVLTERAEVGLLRAYDLVALGRYPYTGWAGRLRSHDHAVVAWALEATGASDLASRDVSELSDGERQRVMIARALAQEPVVLLLDEPTAFLDVARRVEVTTLLRRLARDTGRAVLFSTHELDLALRTADSVWLLDTAGRVRVGAPEDLVLDGSFARSFEVEGLTFDAAAGRF